VMVFAKAVIGYLLGIMGITILFALSPIFICFALFKVPISILSRGCGFWPVSVCRLQSSSCF